MPDDLLLRQPWEGGHTSQAPGQKGSAGEFHRADIVRDRLAQVVGTDAEVFLNVFRIYAGTEVAPWLHRVTAPSLVVTGENDGGCNPRLNRLIEAALPNSELVILPGYKPGYKHSLMLEAGEIVAGHILRFIAALDAG